MDTLKKVPYSGFFMSLKLLMVSVDYIDNYKKETNNPSLFY